MENFIPRKYKDTETNQIVSFDVLLDNKISIILGEPASGKTEQLKNFKENAELIDLINLDVSSQIKADTNYVLLDSIDEALIGVNNFKQLSHKIKNFISNCMANNEDIKFIITCRQLEWNEYFNDDLKKLDSTLKVYQIQDLTKEDISYLLKHKKINEDEFWCFITKNYLQDLLKNILIVKILFITIKKPKMKQ